MARLTLIPEAEVLLGETLGSSGKHIVKAGFWRNKRVAVKLFITTTPEACIAEYEARLSARQHSLATPTIYGWVKFQNDVVPVAGIVMEEFECDLESYIRRAASKWSTPLHTTLHHCITAVECIAALHAANIQHKEINPANLLLDHSGLRVVLCDFELSRILQHESANMGPFATGSVANFTYQPPEAFNNRNVVNASAEHKLRHDVWSIGIVLLRMCTGTVVYRRSNNDLVRVDELRSFFDFAHLFEDGAVPELTTIKFYPLRSILGKCFQTDPALRCSAQQLLDALRSVVDQTTEQDFDAKRSMSEEIDEEFVIVEDEEKADSAAAVQDCKRCDYCGRSFNINRLSKHMEICFNTNSKKRKAFSSAEQRDTYECLRARERSSQNSKWDYSACSAEECRSRHIPKQACPHCNRQFACTVAAKHIAKCSGGSPSGKPNWRVKHEQLMNALRGAAEAKIDLSTESAAQNLDPKSLQPCTFCGRTFRADRVAKHSIVCEKVMTKKRAVFDSANQRAANSWVRMTRLERKSEDLIQSAVVRPLPQPKVAKKRTPEHQECPTCNRTFATKVMRRHVAHCTGSVPVDVKWRLQHQQLQQVIQSYRAVRMAQPKEQCPHCYRHYTASSIARHTAKCQTKINKPEPKWKLDRQQFHNALRALRAAKEVNQDQLTD